MGKLSYATRAVSLLPAVHMCVCACACLCVCTSVCMHLRGPETFAFAHSQISEYTPLPDLAIWGKNKLPPAFYTHGTSNFSPLASVKPREQHL